MSPIPQTPPTDRPLTAGDVPLLREGDVLRSHRKRHFVRCVAAGVIVLEYAAFTAAEFEAARFTFVSRQKVDGGLPDIEAEGERIVRDTYKREGDFGYLWTDVVGAVQTAISEERARHPARPATSAASEGEVERTIDGETVLGFKVAAWRYLGPKDNARFGYRLCEHWSTPGNYPQKVERLFTETQLRAALASPLVSERERELEGALRMAANRMDRLALEVQFDTRLRAEAADWVAEARALTTQPAGEGK